MAVRRAGLSAFGFGGTNFHAVLEEYIPHRMTGGNGKRSRRRQLANFRGHAAGRSHGCPGRLRRCSVRKAPLRGALVIGAASRLHWPNVCVRCRRRRRRPRAGSGRAGRIGSARARTSGHRLRRCRRIGGQVRQGPQGAGGQSAANLEGSARPGHLPWSGARARKSHSSIPDKARST